MLISETWSKVTNSPGFGAQIQKHGIVNVQVDYSELEPTSDGHYVIRDNLKKLFEEVPSSEYIWVRTVSGSSSLTVEETISEGSNKNGGFIDYNDTGTSTTEIVLLPNTWTRITNNGQGAFTNKLYPPYGVTELMDSSGYIDGTELELGDFMLIRNDYTITPSTNNQSVHFRYTLGGGGNEYTLSKTLGRMDEGSGIPYRYSLNTDEIYMGDTNTRDNLIGLEIRTSGGGSLVNSGSVISLVRRTV